MDTGRDSNRNCVVVSISPRPKIFSTACRAQALPPFEQTGFTGGLNWRRNGDRERDVLAFLAHSKIEQPSLFLAGAEDAMIDMYRAFDALEESIRRFSAKVLMGGAGTAAGWISSPRLGRPAAKAAPSKRRPPSLSPDKTPDNALSLTSQVVRFY